MQAKLMVLVCTALLLLAACSQASSSSTPAATAVPTGQAGVSTPSDLDLARSTLVAFFDSLARGDYPAAVKSYGGAIYPLKLLSPKVDPQDHAALFKAACEGRDYAFYCWKIKDIGRQEQISPGRYIFTVRFEDERGKLLTGGDNKTPAPCVPPESCPRSQYTYTVVKVEDKFLVQELPVCAGCWP